MNPFKFTSSSVGIFAILIYECPPKESLIVSKIKSMPDCTYKVCQIVACRNAKQFLKSVKETIF